MKRVNDIKLVATDLDGTFLKDDKSVSEENLLALALLGRKGITRVAATGRNLKKVEEVILGHVPFDYIVFSSGAGVYDWKSKRLLFNQNISEQASAKLIAHFMKRRLNFHVFFPVPDNHKHWYFRGDKNCMEFERYFDYNRAFAYELSNDAIQPREVCQFLLIIPEDEERYLELKREIEDIDNEIRVIRASSPITKGYIWIEVFHRSVSKAQGIKVICDEEKIDYHSTMAIGNDYNDLDMLDFTHLSYLTQNAPTEILDRYDIAPSNEQDGFSFVARRLVNGKEKS